MSNFIWLQAYFRRKGCSLDAQMVYETPSGDQLEMKHSSPLLFLVLYSPPFFSFFFWEGGYFFLFEEEDDILWSSVTVREGTSDEGFEWPWPQSILKYNASRIDIRNRIIWRRKFSYHIVLLLFFISSRSIELAWLNKVSYEGHWPSLSNLTSCNITLPLVQLRLRSQAIILEVLGIRALVGMRRSERDLCCTFTLTAYR